MIRADLSALVQPRGGERAAGKGGLDGQDGAGGAGKGGSGLGALFGAALDDVGGRAREGDRPAAEGAAAREGADDGPARRQDDGALRSLFAGKASLPIRPGALALQAQGEAQGVPPEDGPDGQGGHDGDPPPEGDAGADAARDPGSPLAVLAAIAVGAGAGRPSSAAPAGPGDGSARGGAALAAARAQADAARAGDPSADGMPDAADAPVSRARALFPESADLALATKPEPSVGMALKATVVSQATHLPPALGTANLAAVVEGATALLGEGRGEGSGRANLAFHPDLAAAGAQASLSAKPVKVLTVQLQPISLGTVTIALRLTADGVAMEITAADAKAAAMLRADEKLIVDAVRRTGLAGEIVAIHTADAPRAASQAHAGGDPAAQGNGQASAHANGGSAGGHARGESGRPGPESFTLERRSDDDAPSAPGPRRGGDADGGVYL
ncbi:flagellar hook-length control protein FliK [Salinarimonas rosea]|uniref:flagellar hook-length control protein FliK n=1 Tax=Salinarimonas rosea TaxID=552063 RepID=UPI0004158430|nr:flagellar hook-length control protein FliK [Salinarimonas rosea]